jgi:hypothetical protein
LTHNADRLLVFHRWKGPEHYLVIATLSDTGWPEGYDILLPQGSLPRWREIFSSDAPHFGGDGVANTALAATDGVLRVNLPARGLIVLRQMPDAG